MEQKTFFPRSLSDASDAYRSDVEVMCPSCRRIHTIGTHPRNDDTIEDAVTRKEFPTSLTKRETEVLELILAGDTNKKIARKIYRTERTVEYHRNRLMRKLGTHSITDLVKRAIQMGIAV